MDDHWAEAPAQPEATPACGAPVSAASRRTEAGETAEMGPQARCGGSKRIHVTFPPA